MFCCNTSRTLAGTGHFAILAGTGGGGVDTTPPSVWPLIELELRGKDERVARDETKPMVSDFKVLGHRMTSEVRSMTQNHRIPFLPLERLLIKLEPHSKDRDVPFGP